MGLITSQVYDKLSIRKIISGKVKNVKLMKFSDSFYDFDVSNTSQSV